MFVIEVIPLQKATVIESLTYYSAYSYPLGTIIAVPLRSQEVRAIIIGINPVSVAKTALKTATFTLRKLPIQENTKRIPESVLKTAQKISETIPASVGAILFSMLPPEIRTGDFLYPTSTFHVGSDDATPQILTDATANRFITYRSVIRETFAHRGSLVFVVPTASAVEEARKKLELGIENRIITFSSTHSRTQLRASYEAFEDLRHSKLIIVTPQYAFLDRHDITTIIVEKSGSPHYKLRTRPYLDMREVLKCYAQTTKRTVLLGDTLPQTEDEVKRREDVYTTHHEHSKRIELPGTLVLAPHPKKESGEEFSLCTQRLSEAIERTLAQRGHVFLFAARKGLAPLVTCFDCGHVFRCPDSGAPYSLLRTWKGEEEERWFFSSTSGKRVRAADTCPTCGSWRLREQGIGIQHVYDYVRTQFPKTDIFIFDHTTATSHAKAKKIANQFYESKKGILIGTQMALSYLHKPVDVTAVMSYEATRAIPTWKSDETVFALLLQLREITQKDVLVQLRSDPDEILGFAAKGLLDQFYDEEISVRRALSYPPYATFILLSWMGTKVQTKEIEQAVAKMLGETEVTYYSSPESNSAKTTRYGLIRHTQSVESLKKLVETLRHFPPYIRIEVNPDKIV